MRDVVNIVVDHHLLEDVKILYIVQTSVVGLHGGITIVMDRPIYSPPMCYPEFMSMYANGGKIIVLDNSISLPYDDGQQSYVPDRAYRVDLVSGTGKQIPS